jgi:hypothetical protein
MQIFSGSRGLGCISGKLLEHAVSARPKNHTLRTTDVVGLSSRLLGFPLYVDEIISGGTEQSPPKPPDQGRIVSFPVPTAALTLIKKILSVTCFLQNL